jgi:hypothetical protein
MSSAPWIGEPDKENNRKYEKLLLVFALSAEYLAKISDALREIGLEIFRLFFLIIDMQDGGFYNQL